MRQMRNGRSRSRGGNYAAAAAVAVTAVLIAVNAAGAVNAAQVYEIRGIAADTAWHPATLTVQTGDTVRWVFEGGVHNVKSTSANWNFTGGYPSSDPAPYTFTAEGAYTFVCEIHEVQGMSGTITVQDEPVDPTPDPDPDPSPSPSPSPAPTPQPSGPGTTTPPPSGGDDTVKPTVAGIRTKALRRAVRVQFRLSEPATVTVRVKRRGSRKVLKAKRVQALAGTSTVTLRSKRLKRGRYTVEIQARDAYGNRSSLVKKQLTLRS
jgi:plastocyanin